MFLAGHVFGQKQGGLVRKIISEKTYGNRFNDQMARATNSYDGGSLCVGSTEAPNSGGWDGLLIKFDRQGKQVFQLSLDNGDEDHATTVCEGPMGHILIGGTSTRESTGASKDKKMETGWLMCRDINGDELWQTQLDSSKTDEVFVRDVVWVESLHEFHCIGTHNGWLWWAALDENGQLIHRVQYEKELGKQVTTARMRYQNESIYIFAAAKLGKNQQMPVFVKISQTGVFQKYVPLPDNNVVMTGNFIPLGRGKFLATGSVKNGLDRGDIFLLKLDEDMTKDGCIFYNNFHDHGYDEGVDLVKLSGNQFYVVGSSSSQSTGSNTNNFAAWLLKGDGSMADPKGWYFGNKLEERGCQLLQKNDGSLWLFGTKDVGSQWGANDNFYVACLQKGAEKEPDPTEATPVAVIKAVGKGFVSKSDSPLLHSNEKGHLVFDLQNEGKETVEGLWATVRCADCGSGIFVPDTLQIKPVEASTIRQLTIPIIAGQLGETRQNQVTVAIFDQRGKMLQSVKGQFESEKLKMLNFKLIESRFSCNGEEKIQKGRPVKFCLEIENTGDMDARDLQLTFSVPERVNYQGAYEFSTPVLLQKGRKKYDIVLLPEAQLLGSELVLDAFLITAGSDSVFRWSFRTPIMEEEIKPVDISTAIAAKEKIQLPTSETPNNGQPSGNNIEVQMPKSKAESNEGFKLLVTWADGSEDFDQKLTVLSDSFMVKVIAASVKELKIGDFTIIINGERKTLDGNKFEEEPLKILPKSSANKPNQFRFAHKMPLKVGENTISVEVKTPDGLVEQTEELKIVYKPIDKGTLYVWSIGVPDNSPNGLKYTQQDARDFAEIFQKQQGRLFGTVEIKTLTTAEETNFEKLGEVISEIETKGNRGLLKKHDAVVIFISSHGEEGDDGTFRLRASNYKGNNRKFTTISYEKDILETLDALPCKKFVFIDACHSGAMFAENSNGRKSGETSYSDAIINLANAENSVWTMSSCGKQEYSFEDDRWQNGAFTKVLKGVFSNAALCKQLDKGIKGKTKPDGALSMAEIYEYVQKEVNELVKKERKESQTPYIAPRLLMEDAPFFSY